MLTTFFILTQLFYSWSKVRTKWHGNISEVMCHYELYCCKASRFGMGDFDHEIATDISKELQYKNVITAKTSLIPAKLCSWLYFFKQIATSVQRGTTHAQLMKRVWTRLDLTRAIVFLGTLERQETVKVIFCYYLFWNTRSVILPFILFHWTHISNDCKHRNQRLKVLRYDMIAIYWKK